MLLVKENEEIHYVEVNFLFSYASCKKRPCGIVTIIKEYTQKELKCY